MKKQIFVFLRTVLMLGMMLSLLCFVANAAEISSEGNSQSGGTSIHATTTVTSYPEFTVTIPTGIPLGSITRTSETSYHSVTFDVTVDEISSLGDAQIRVSISTPDERFCLKNGVYELPYALYDSAEGGNLLTESGAVFAVFEENGTATGRVVVDQSQIPAPGSYSGTLIFTVSIIEADESED